VSVKKTKRLTTPDGISVKAGGKVSKKTGGQGEIASWKVDGKRAAEKKKEQKKRPIYERKRANDKK